jgi:hypothetical protein
MTNHICSLILGSDFTLHDATFKNAECSKDEISMCFSDVCVQQGNEYAFIIVELRLRGIRKISLDGLPLSSFKMSDYSAEVLNFNLSLNQLDMYLAWEDENLTVSRYNNYRFIFQNYVYECFWENEQNAEK